MRNLLLIFGLLVSLSTSAQVEYDYLYDPGCLKLVYGYIWFVDMEGPGVFEATIQLKEDTGQPYYFPPVLASKQFELSLDSGPQYLFLFDTAEVDCGTQYFSGLCFPDLVDNCMSYLQYYPAFEGCEPLYDTIPVFDTTVQVVYDTVRVFDTIHVLDTLIQFDTNLVQIFDTLIHNDTVPVYMVYEIEDTLGLGLETHSHYFIRIIDNDRIAIDLPVQEAAIYDLQGVKVRVGRENISLSGIPPGIYILEVVLPDRRTFSTKFLRK